MINKKKVMKEFLITGVMLVMLCSLVSALGLSSSYHDLNYLKVGPGETKEVVFGNFQNTGDKEMILKVELIEGSEIARLTNSNLDNFVIPAGKLDAGLNVEVSIPKEVPEGTEYNIKIRYSDITGQVGEGMVTMTSSKTSSIPVLVETVPDESSGSSNILLWVLGIVLVIIIIFVLSKMIKKK